MLINAFFRVYQKSLNSILRKQIEDFIESKMS